MLVLGVFNIFKQNTIDLIENAIFSNLFRIQKSIVIDAKIAPKILI